MSHKKTGLTPAVKFYNLLECIYAFLKLIIKNAALHTDQPSHI